MTMRLAICRGPASLLILAACVLAAPGQTPEQKRAAKLSLSLTAPTSSRPRVDLQVMLAEVDWTSPAHVQPGILCPALFDRNKAGSFVFTASSSAVDGIIRALQAQGRCEIVAETTPLHRRICPFSSRSGKSL